MPRRNVTAEEFDPRERYALYRLCECTRCGGKGKELIDVSSYALPLQVKEERCPDCRGEGRIRQEVASAATPEDVGLALVTLAREGEFSECPVGLLDRMPECEDCGGNGWDWARGRYGERRIGCHTCHGSGIKPTGTWLLKPWLPSARNVTDAARTLAKSKKSTTP